MNILKRNILALSLLLSLAAGVQATPAAVDTVQRHVYHIEALTRGRQSEIVVRWAPDEYPSWAFLNHSGYRLRRIHFSTDTTALLVSDTLVDCLRPLTLDQFKQHYAANDTLAAVAAQLIYVQGTTLATTETRPNSMGAVVEVYEQQQQRFGMAMLVAERRLDLAESMGLAYIDRTAQPGIQYQYVIEPLLPDSIIDVHSRMTDFVSLGSWTPEPCAIELHDSLEAPARVILSWDPGQSSSFEIERRTLGTIGYESSSSWSRLTTHPYVVMLPEGGTGEALFTDDVPVPGTYEYRVSSYDSFGDLSAPSEPHRIEMPDLVPPMAPEIRFFQVFRADSATYAIVHFCKDSIEQDLRGYQPLYRQTTGDDQAWIPVGKELVAPRDTVCLVDITGLGTGEMCLASVDTVGNMRLSMPKPLFLADYEAPAPPSGLRSYVTLKGLVYLFWNPSPEPDLHSYQVYYSNDLDNEFVQKPGYNPTDTCMVDTLSLRVAQPYIYYYLRALDYSGNASEPSDTIRVERPNLTAPGKCRIDSISDYGNDDWIRMRWIVSADPDIAVVRVFRRTETAEGEEVPRTAWTLIATIPAEEIDHNHVVVTDSVPRNVHRGYVYASEAINRTGIPSELSNQVLYHHVGATVVPVTLSLKGSYRQDDRGAVLVWESKGIRDSWRAESYFGIYRQMEDETFRYLGSANISDLSFTDYRLPRGKKATYRIRLLTGDGRVSPYSNTVTVTNTLPEEEDGKQKE